MNQERKERLGWIIDCLDNDLDNLQALQEGEQLAYNNLPEDLQQSFAGQAMAEAAEDLWELYKEGVDYLNKLKNFKEQ